MAAVHNVTLFLLFSSIEKDLVGHIRKFSEGDLRLTPDETEKAKRRMDARSALTSESGEAVDLLFGLDLGEKFDILRRHKDNMDYTTRAYFDGLADIFQKAIPIRNSIMHGRPLLINEQILGSTIASRLLSTPSYWPHLKQAQKDYTSDPIAFMSRAGSFFDNAPPSQVLHNLPSPDYDDTGFMPRPSLEKDLRKKLLGRYPVVTVLGDGGNGKSALALQTLYSLTASDEHDFEAILWYTAKTARLSENGITSINDVITDSLEIIKTVAEYEPGDDKPSLRLRRLLEENKILLAIDNLETITGTAISDLAKDMPGQSKLLVTSRIPLGGDISVNVREFTDAEAITYLQRLIQAYDVAQLRRIDIPRLKFYAIRLGSKPLLLKWFVLCVKKGVSPDSIVANPEEPLRFCLENVVDRLGEEARAVVVVLAVMPMPCSPALIEEVSNLTPVDILAGLNELTMFSLVDFERDNGSEQLFKIRPLVRSYITRVVEPRPSLTSDILARHRRVEAEFQGLRSRLQNDCFNVRTMTVRSRSEMLSSDKLRDAVSATLDGDYESADAIITEVRLTDPSYFEVYRADAFLAQQMGDWNRTNVSFEAALELEPKLPQLWYFFGLSLMRQLENARASDCFTRARELGGDHFFVHRDSARNYFMLFDFAAAQASVELAEGVAKSDRELTMAADLRVQLLSRKMQHLVDNGRELEASAVVTELVDKLGGIPGEQVDKRLLEHVRKAVVSIKMIMKSGHLPREALAQIEDFIGVNLSKSEGEQGAVRRGTLYVASSNTYGFLQEADGSETFIHKSATTSRVWSRLVSGEAALFETEEGRSGRQQACHVRLASEVTTD